jgi:hypothetical protein
MTLNYSFSYHSTITAPFAGVSCGEWCSANTCEPTAASEDMWIP